MHNLAFCLIRKLDVISSVAVFKRVHCEAKVTEVKTVFKVKTDTIIPPPFVGYEVYSVSLCRLQLETAVFIQHRPHHRRQKYSHSSEWKLKGARSNFPRLNQVRPLYLPPSPTLCPSVSADILKRYRKYTTVILFFRMPILKDCLCALVKVLLWIVNHLLR